jgi:hypothetical protein
MYMFRYSEDQDSQGNSMYYHVTKNISFKNVPKKYRNKEIVAFNMENVNDKM